MIDRAHKSFIQGCLVLLQAACVFFIGPAVMAVEPGMVAKAEKGSLPVLEILEDQQVSIADLHEVPISEASGNVYVITDEDIRHSGATDIPTLLRRIPGIEVMQMTGADFNVSVRGNNQQAANKLLVLVDGRSIYEDTFGSVFWTLLPVTLPEIKRIEVLKGPASAIYGFNAFDGVVNIITKSPEEMKGSTNGTTLQFGGGEFGTVRAAAVQAGTYEKLGYRLSVGHDQNQKWSDRNQLALRANKFNVLTEYSLAGWSSLAASWIPTASTARYSMWCMKNPQSPTAMPTWNIEGPISFFEATGSDGARTARSSLIRAWRLSSDLPTGILT